ncbi:MAG: cellulase family glycosylhydrolase [Actinobacteria bacterium]|nr:cellulase family glycosylhydrolase [Actinomycetota bacterium]
MRILAAVVGLALAVSAPLVPAGPAGAGEPSLASAGLSQSGRWITTSDGRVVVLHGLNQVFKVAPYEPGADGFGDDDAAFLAANGFDAMRIGVIWAAVEPTPGHYDEQYLDSIADTVQTLAAHGIVSLLDFHQDLYHEEFQGECAPAWAVQDGGLPNPALGFPGNYLANPAEWATWDGFWRNAPASDGVGLQDHYARAVAHVAARFAHDPAVVGYDVMNEPWPGTLGEVCAVPLLGCPLFDATALTSFYRRVIAAVRPVDATQTLYVEPNVLFTQSDTTDVGPLGDSRVGFSYHDYCSTEELTQSNLLCPPQDELTVSRAAAYAQDHGMPPLLTEFGATSDLANIASVESLADKYRTGWLEWAYTGNDKTSASPDGQALVLDPSQPPTGANVLTDKLKVPAEPYPQVVAGTPTAWSLASGVFTLDYSTARADGAGRFPAGAQTVVAVPAIQYPAGYRVTVSGARVVSPPNAPTLLLAADAGATVVDVTVATA